MPRLRRHRSRLLDKAATRVASISSIDTDYRFGPIKLEDLRNALKEAKTAQETYNRLLSEVDAAQRAFQNHEAEVNDLATRLFASVGARFGHDSNEYLKAGGKPKPTRRKRRPKT